MGLMSRGMSFLNSKLQVAADETVTYTRCEISGSPSGAVPGGNPSGTNLPGQGEARVDWTEQDFLVPVGSLAAVGIEEPPRRGDLVTWAVNGVAMLFRVEKRGDEDCWRFSGPPGQVYRVHTKRE